MVIFSIFSSENTVVLEEKLPKMSKGTHAPAVGCAAAAVGVVAVAAAGCGVAVLERVFVWVAWRLVVAGLGGLLRRRGRELRSQRVSEPRQIAVRVAEQQQQSAAFHQRDAVHL